MIYFDHNATTPIDPRTLAALHDAFNRHWAHPQSLHRAGRQAAEVWEDTNHRLLEHLNVDPHDRDSLQIHWMGSGTWANRVALEALTATCPLRADAPRNLVVSSVEHPSILEPASKIARNGFELKRLPVDRSGLVDLERLREFVAGHPCWVAVQWANHETGVIQPIDEIARICRSAGVPLHVDAVQAIGKLDCHWSAWQLDSLVLSAHKFGGPRGAAAWIVLESLRPRIHESARAGTPPVELAWATVDALERTSRSDVRRRLAAWRDELQHALQTAFPGAVVHGSDAPRVCQTLSMAFPPLERQSLLMALDLAGVCCSAGAACASGAAEPAPSLAAMGLPQSLIDSSIRLSLGPSTTEIELRDGISLIRRILCRLREKHR